MRGAGPPLGAKEEGAHGLKEDAQVESSWAHWPPARARRLACAPQVRSLPNPRSALAHHGRHLQPFPGHCGREGMGWGRRCTAFLLPRTAPRPHSDSQGPARTEVPRGCPPTCGACVGKSLHLADLTSGGANVPLPGAHSVFFGGGTVGGGRGPHLCACLWRASRVRAVQRPASRAAAWPALSPTAFPPKQDVVGLALQACPKSRFVARLAAGDYVLALGALAEQAPGPRADAGPRQEGGWWWAGRMALQAAAVPCPAADASAKRTHAHHG